MADSPQTKADLLTSFADNAIGAITEQNLRDFVMSVLGQFGGIYVINGTTNQPVTATPQKLINWTENSLFVGPTPDFANSEITANTEGVYRIESKLAFSGSNSDTYLIAVYIDTGSGFVDAGIPRIKRKLGTGGDVGSTSIHGFLDLNPGDKIALYVWSTTGGTAFTIEEATFSMTRVQ